MKTSDYKIDPLVFFLNQAAWRLSHFLRPPWSFQLSLKQRLSSKMIVLTVRFLDDMSL